MDPIAHQFELPCTPAQAFDIYVGRISEWWHPDYTPNPATLQSVTIEPAVGGRVYFTHSDLGEIQWGEVTSYEPAASLAHTSTLAQSREHPSLITVKFTPTSVGCTLNFEHGGWTPENAADRSKFGDWPRILERYVALIS